ncbi:MAG: type II toxin-antitoxin system HicA family toxin [Vulcanibacillus sp.]
MTPSLPIVSGKEIVQALQKNGFEKVSQKGSHFKLKRLDGRIAIVPMHNDLATGTLRSILRQAGLSVEDLYKIL